MKKIVTIGGGSGQFNLLSALRDIDEIEIASVVSMVDSGGSTGRLRDELGILPPGDILKCILALSPDRDYARKLLQKRISRESRLKDHSVGNLLLTILSQHAGSFPEGVKALKEVLDVKGKVLPVTIDKATLVAELTDGSFLYGESAIDVPRGDQREKIKNTFLVPHHSDEIKVYPPVVETIGLADYIILGPGDLFTSIVPNLLVPGVRETIQKNKKAKLVFVVNVMTKFGETDNYKATDFVKKIEEFVGRKIDVVLVNSEKPTQNILDEYKKQKANFVENGVKDREVVTADLIDTKGGVVRHSVKKLGKVLESIIK